MKKLVWAVVALSTLAVASGCTATIDESNASSSEEAIIKPPPPPIINPLHDIPMNGLPTRALVQNLLATNDSNSVEFISSPLNSETFAAHPNLAAAVAEPGTRDFLRYVVTCALAPDAHVQVRTPAGSMQDMPGGLGLCPAWGTASIRADLGCQQRVSSCVLLFNNPTGVTVPVSIRGASDSAGSRTAVGNRLRPVRIQSKETGFDPAPTLASFNACPAGSYGVGTACGWNPSDDDTGVIGTCSPGAVVHVGTGAPCSTPVLGASSGDSVLRVCSGLRGCDPGSTADLGANDDACGTLDSYVTFSCPSGGIFNVMTAPYDRATPISTTTGASSDTPGGVTYPAHETDLFKVREGAFYGNIFDPSALAVSYTFNGGVWQSQQLIPPQQIPTPYLGMFACSDPSWGDQASSFTSRICAKDSASNPCAAQYTGSCASSCAAADTTAYGAYGSCTGKKFSSAPAVTSTSLTSFVNTPCDMSGMWCGVLLAHP